MNSVVQHPFLATAARFPNAPALISTGKTLSYSELERLARHIYHMFQQQGLKPGELVVLDKLAPFDLLVLLLTCSLAGLVAFPLNDRYPVAKLKKIAETTGPALVISNRALLKDISVTPQCLYSGNQSTSTDWVQMDPNLPATYLMTSGSSGKSKLVVHSLENHWASARGSNLNIPLGPTDRWVLSLPLYHVGGLSILYRCALVGAAVIIPQDQSALLSTASGGTHISLVTTQLQRLIQIPAAANILQTFKVILLGGSAIPQSLIQTALDLNLPILTSYGSTELASQITTVDPAERQTALTCSGKILAERDLIIDHNGEILVKGNTLALGYRRGSSFSDLRDEQGWFHSGDVGYLDVDGHLTVVGRRDNQFISGGENIQPEYIEAVLSRISGIGQVLVLPQPDDTFGYRPTAYLELINPQLELKAVLAKLKRILPGFMQPVSYYRLPPSLLTDHQKLSRHALHNYVLQTNKLLESLLP